MLSDQTKFDQIKNRVKDMQQTHLEAIEKGAFLRMHPAIISEMAWLVAEIDRLVGSARSLGRAHGVESEEELKELAERLAMASAEEEPAALPRK